MGDDQLYVEALQGPIVCARDHRSDVGLDEPDVLYGAEGGLMGHDQTARSGRHRAIPPRTVQRGYSVWPYRPSELIVLI